MTSDTGAAIHDLLSVLERRAPQVRVVLRPARVQGPGAAEDIAEGIRELDEWGGADVLIVGRGGGSMEDLWAFNEEPVARAIHACWTPVISAVGHEVDTTIADFVADYRAPTPSVAAEVAAPARADLLAELEDAGDRMAAAWKDMLDRRRERIRQLGTSAAFRRPLEFYRRRSQDVDTLAARLETGLTAQLEGARIRLEAHAGRLDGAVAHGLERGRLQLAAQSGRLNALSPLAVLERGYAIAHGADGGVLKEADDASAGDEITVRLGRGELDCRVDAVRRSPEQAGAGRETG